MSGTILKISDLYFSYSSKEVISGLSLNLEYGDKLIIAGPNGSGKTTLLKCIMGNILPSDGSISKADDINIAYCKQDFPNSKFPISAREVVEMGIYKSNEKSAVKKAMELTKTSHLADRAFYGLSGGERQRVSLARCFAQNANLLLFDEPSSFLDSDSRHTFADIMRNLPDDIAAIVVTHDNDLIKELGWKVLCLGGKR